MREIKFRVWYVGLETMLSEYLGFQITDNGNLLIEAFDGEEAIYEKVESDEYIVMQYTGLKDKNGVEIYEGDVIEATAIYGGNYGVKHIYEIEYSGSAFVGIGEEKDFEFQLVGSFAELHRLEVIGNIYEKELSE